MFSHYVVIVSTAWERDVHIFETLWRLETNTNTEDVVIFSDF